jgi:hypothetical protein
LKKRVEGRKANGSKEKGKESRKERENKNGKCVLLSNRVA